MTEAQPSTKRPDIDIERAIHNLYTRYPPMMHDRHRVKLQVEDGEVTVSGHIKSKITYQLLLQNLPTVAGISAIHADKLYNDETIRFQVGRSVPVGMLVTVEYGAVVLSGRLPDDTNIEALVAQIAKVPGVNRVLTTFQT